MKGEGMIEEVGRTREEAVARAVATLGIARAEAVVTVLEEKRHRFLGLFGGPQVRVRVERREGRRPGREGRDGRSGRRSGEARREAIDTAGDAARVKRIVEGILLSMGVTSTVTVDENGDGRRRVRIESDESDGLLIGRHGQTLLAIEHVANRILTKARDDRPLVEVDVNGYRERNGEALEQEAEPEARRAHRGRSRGRRGRARVGAS
jgi:predicted RNA-binding protein Jag